MPVLAFSLVDARSSSCMVISRHGKLDSSPEPEASLGKGQAQFVADGEVEDRG